MKLQLMTIFSVFGKLFGVFALESQKLASFRSGVPGTLCALFVVVDRGCAATSQAFRMVFMNSEDTRSGGSKALGASVLASLLVIGASGSAEANPDRDAMRANLLDARNDLRAARQEARETRRAERFENRINRVDSIVTPGFPVPERGNTERIMRSFDSSNIRGAHRNSMGNNLPGSVSEFRTTRPRSTYINDSGRSRLITRGVSLDLSSTRANITVGENLIDGSTTLQVGSETKTFSAGSKVTAAEYAALSQKLATGDQTLVLTASGAAAGGNLNLNAVSDDGSNIRASELVIPKDVTVTGDFARTADGVRVSKDITNFGSLLAVSSNANKNTAVIGARDINNEQGASIASQATASNPELNLTLKADRDLNNQGSITSAGNLELSAGRSINNVGFVSAEKDISLTGTPDTKLLVNNYGGSLNALNGSINLRETGYNGYADSIIFGGNLFSQEVNINAGQGTGDIIANQVTGKVNATGLAAHVSTNTSDLIIGDQCLTGDPTYYNTGNIIIGGNINVAETLAIIAGGNITTNQTNLAIIARDGSGNGCDINIIAGADVTAGSGEISPAGGPAILPGQPPITQNATAPVTFSTNSATGGVIDFTSATSVNIQTSGFGTDKNGADITLAAFADGSGNNGQVLIGTDNFIQSGGTGTGNNGNINVFAGGTTGNVILLNQVVTTGGSGPTGGDINVVTAQPTTSDGGPITFATDGSITSGNSIVASPTANAGASATGVFTGNRITWIKVGGNFDANLFGSADAIVTSDAGDITVSGITVNSLQMTAFAGNISSAGVITTASALQLTAAGDVTLGSNVNAASETITAGGDIQINAHQKAPGSMVFVAGGDITGNTNISFDGTDPGLSGANITFVAGASFTDSLTEITITGNSLTGGNIDFTAAGTGPSFSTFGSAGGKLSMTAFASGGLGGRILFPTTSLIETYGTAADGDVNIIAGAPTGQAITFGTIDTSSSSFAGANVTVLAEQPTNNPVQIFKFTGLSSAPFTSGNRTDGDITTGPISSRGADIFVASLTGDISVGEIENGFTSGNGSGGVVNLRSPGGTVTAGNIFANGFGSGNGGTIHVLATDIITAELQAKSINSGTTGGTITLSVISNSPLIIDDVISVSGGSNGGAISITNDGNGGINFVNSPIAAFGPNNGGTILITTPGTIATTDTFQLNTGGGNGFDGGSIYISAPNAVFGGLTSMVTGGDSGSGTIDYVIGTTTSNGNSFGLNASGDVNLVDNATFDLTGASGGEINLISQGSIVGNNVSIDTSATGAGGNAGNMNLTAGSDLTIGQLTGTGNTTGSGAIVTVQSGSGTINLGDVNVDGGLTNGGGGSVLVTGNGVGTSVVRSISARSFGTGAGGGISLTNPGGGDIHIAANSVLRTTGQNPGYIYINLSDLGTLQFLGGNTTLDASGSTGQGSVDLTDLGFLELNSTNLSIQSYSLAISTSPVGGINSAGGDLTINSGEGFFQIDLGSNGITSNGGDISFTSASSISIVGDITTSSTTGPSGSVLMSANYFLASGQNIDTSAGANNQDAGAISLTGTTLTGSSYGNLTANGLGTGDGGAITIDILSASLGAISAKGGANGVGGAVQLDIDNVFTLTNTIDASGGAGGGDVTITSTFTINLNASIAGGDISVSTSQIPGPFIVVNANITGSGNVDLLANGVSQTSGLITGNILSITSETGAEFTTNVNSITIDSNTSFGAEFSIIETNSIAIGSVTVRELNVTAATGTISVTETLNLFDVDLIASDGNIAVNSNISANNSIFLEASDGNISSSSAVLTAPNLTVSLQGATPGTATLTANNDVDTLAGSGGGTITFNNGSNALELDVLGADQSLVATTTNTATGIEVTGDFTTTGTIVLNTRRVSFESDITAAGITAQNLTGDLDVNSDSFGNVTGTTPTAGAPGTPSAPTAINFNTANGANLNLSGGLSFSGDVTFNNIGGTTTTADFSLFSGDNNVVLLTNDWLQGTSSNITGNIFIFSGTAIVNANGDVNLSQNAVFNGRSLVIAARNNVNLGNFIIDTSSTNGSGGDVTIIAGFNLTPPGPQVESSGLFTVTGPSSGGGSVTIGGAGTINTSSQSGNGGDVTIVTNGGSVAIGDIDTTGGMVGGTVTIIGGTGIAASDIDTTGATGSGNVYLQTTNAEITPGPTLTIAAGIVTGGSFYAGGTGGGTIAVNDITAPTGTVSINNINSPINLNGTLVANDISLVASNSTINFNGSSTLEATADSAGNGGDIYVFANAITATGGTLHVVAQGEGSGAGGSIFFLTRADMNVDASGDVTFDASAPGAGGRLTLQTEGNLTINGGINVGGIDGDGASIELTAGVNDFTGTLTLNDTSFLTAASANGTNGDGGKIALYGQFINFASTSSAPLELRATGTGTGNGGQVTYQTDSPATVVLGTLAKPPKGDVRYLLVDARSGASGGAGGKISLLSGGNIIINTAAMLAAPRSASGNWDGAEYYLTSTNATGKTGTILITGNIDAANRGTGDGGRIDILTNSKQDFVIGGTKAPKNGILGQLLAGTGTVEVSNDGGGINVATTAALNARNVTLEAALKGGINAGTGVTITALNNLTLHTDAGSIGKKQLLVSAPNLRLTSNTGSVNVSDTFNGATRLEEGEAGKDFILTTTGALTVSADIETTSGSISITGGGTSLVFEAGTHAVANNGAITILLPSTSGSILIDDGAIVETAGKGKDVKIAIGALPKKPVASATPAGITADPEGKGKIFFGPLNSVETTGAATVEAINKNVIFNNTSTTTKITLGDGVLIKADPPSKAPLTMSLPIASEPSMESAASLSMPFSAASQLTSTERTLSFDSSQINLMNVNRVSLDAPTTEETTLTTAKTSNVKLSSDVIEELEDLTISAAFHNEAESVESGKHNLSRGNMVFAPSKDTVVETAHGTIEIKAGAIALLMQMKDGLAVYDLHDQSKNAIVVSVAGKRISLSPGRHVLVSSRPEADFAGINPIELVQYRRLDRSKLSNGWNLHTSEFSIPSACYAVKPLRSLMNSNEQKSKLMAKKLMKTTAVLMTLSPDRGDFVQYFKPSKLAMR